MARREILVDAILFDMDGTLIATTAAAEETYKRFCVKYNLTHVGHPHGVRMVDSLRKWFPDASEDRIAAMAVEFEEDLLVIAQELAAEGKEGIVILPGVQRLLSEIRSSRNAEDHYTICTSATRLFASKALSTAGIVPPSRLLAADDCTHGKPHPEPYLKGAALLSKDPKACVVIEDAPAGIKSGLAAGATVIAVCTSHTAEQLAGLGAHYIVQTLEQVSVSWDHSSMKLLIEQTEELR